MSCDISMHFMQINAEQAGPRPMAMAQSLARAAFYNSLDKSAPQRLDTADPAPDAVSCMPRLTGCCRLMVVVLSGGACGNLQRR
jgi:hypothetical protein